MEHAERSAQQVRFAPVENVSFPVHQDKTTAAAPASTPPTTGLIAEAVPRLASLVRSATTALVWSRAPQGKPFAAAFVSTAKLTLPTAAHAEKPAPLDSVAATELVSFPASRG